MSEPARPSIVPTAPSIAPKAPQKSFFERATRGSREVLEHIGAISTLLWDTIRATPKRPFEMYQVIYQLEQMGVRSVTIASITAVFVGMVMTVQFAFSLERFGARDYVGRVVGLSITRELAPALTALVVGCRIGAGIAAELGSMAVTEQIDAIHALGADPVKKLVVPRMIACIVLMPILCVFADVLGFAAAMLVAYVQFGTSPSFFYRSGLDSVEMSDFLSGVLKTPFFGAEIALLGCYLGMTTRGGTEGVGKSTTRAVVAISVAVLLSDFFLTKLFISFGPSAG
ncbi:MAG: ABC transporter permease [Deltaproteobacteria bacterium]|nr:ABC transporter permease [Deltaproteobacteria bacterium]